MPTPPAVPAPLVPPVPPVASLPAPPLAWPAAGFVALTAVAAFHSAYLIPGMAWLMVVFIAALVALTRLPSNRSAFFLPFAVGLLCYTPHLLFFHTIFNLFAVALWMVLPFYLALFVWLGRLARRHLPRGVGLALLPILWFGLEYFRCEANPLKFAWLTPTLAFADHPPAGVLYTLGSFGFGALLVALAVPFSVLAPRTKEFYLYTAAAGLGIALLYLPAAFVPADRAANAPAVTAVGVQTETLQDDPSLAALDAARQAHPDAPLFVLSEYAFTGRVPQAFQNWCRIRQVYLIGGGSDLVSRTPRKKYNTAFVVGPDGKVVFQQAKSVPIQFFDDGLPATSQEIWPSPWGALGMCICYDLSYTGVIDAYAAKGAQAMIVPTMDVIAWGAHEHWLHTRIAPIRAAEYGLPIFRLCSSGISQAVDADGLVTATAPFPGIGETLTATLHLSRHPGHRPWDRALAIPAMLLPPLIFLWAVLVEIRRRWKRFYTAAQAS